MVKVVVVEDNDLNLKLFEDLLNLMNCEISSTNNGHEALNLIKRVVPDLILMDIQLNGISGIDIIRELKETPGLSEIPIIAVSAYAMKHEESSIRKSGCEEYLSKPLSIEDFFAVVKKYITKQK